MWLVDSRHKASYFVVFHLACTTFFFPLFSQEKTDVVQTFFSQNYPITSHTLAVKRQKIVILVYKPMYQKMIAPLASLQNNRSSGPDECRVYTHNSRVQVYGRSRR